MGLSRSRTITLIVALATLTSNTLSSLLFAQLPDDPFHLASNFGWYLHFANILSVFGFIGALRQHALSVAIFANYLILDTILCSIPRFLLLSLLNTFSSTLCSTPSSSSVNPTSTSQIQSSLTENDEDCVHILQLAQITLGAGVIAATVLQFVGALCVREYARGLWVRECREEILAVEDLLERGLRKDEEQRTKERLVEEWGLRREQEQNRRERLVEEWGFGGLPVIAEEEEKV